MLDGFPQGIHKAEARLELRQMFRPSGPCRCVESCGRSICGQGTALGENWLVTALVFLRNPQKLIIPNPAATAILLWLWLRLRLLLRPLLRLPLWLGLLRLLLMSTASTAAATATATAACLLKAVTYVRITSILWHRQLCFWISQPQIRPQNPSIIS